jgi:hypothetical protein
MLTGPLAHTSSTPTPLQHPHFFNIDTSSAPTPLRHPRLLNTETSSTPTPLRHRHLFYTDTSSTPTPLQHRHLFDTDTSSAPTPLQHPPCPALVGIAHGNSPGGPPSSIYLSTVRSRFASRALLASSDGQLMSRASDVAYRQASLFPQPPPPPFPPPVWGRPPRNAHH